jgi:hypothetical protein
MTKSSTRLKEFIDKLELSLDGFRVAFAIKTSLTIAKRTHSD